MAETAEAPAAAPVAKKTKTAAKPKKSKTAPAHPKVSEMVNSAIASLKERGGSSLQAIKKHIASNHKVDVEKLSPFIKKYLRNAVASGTLVQTKGKGATGSFRMSATTSGKPKPVKKSPAAKAVKKPKPAAPKAKQAKKSVKSKITKKAKVVKPKAPKPKKAKKPVKKAPAKKGAKK